MDSTQEEGDLMEMKTAVRRRYDKSLHSWTADGDEGEEGQHAAGLVAMEICSYLHISRQDLHAGIVVEAERDLDA